MGAGQGAAQGQEGQLFPRDQQGQRTRQINDWFLDQQVSDLIDQRVVAENGDWLGDVNEIGVSNNQLQVVVGVGGFLGIGERAVAIPLNEFSREGDRIMLPGYTMEQLQQMPQYDEAELRILNEDESISDYAA